MSILRCKNFLQAVEGDTQGDNCLKCLHIGSELLEANLKAKNKNFYISIIDNKSTLNSVSTTPPTIVLFFVSRYNKHFKVLGKIFWTESFCV